MSHNQRVHIYKYIFLSLFPCLWKASYHQKTINFSPNLQHEANIFENILAVTGADGTGRRSPKWRHRIQIVAKPRRPEYRSHLLIPSIYLLSLFLLPLLLLLFLRPYHFSLEGFNPETGSRIMQWNQYEKLVISDVTRSPHDRSSRSLLSSETSVYSDGRVWFLTTRVNGSGQERRGKRAPESS